MKSPEPPAVVRHITKDHVTIAPAEGYSVTVFNIAGGSVEAVVCADDCTETIRLLIAAPSADQTMAITTLSRTRVIDILYTDRK